MLIWMRGKELKALSTGKGKKPGEWTPTGPKGSGQGQQWRDVAGFEELLGEASRTSGIPLRIADVLEDTSGTLMVEVQRIPPSPVPGRGLYKGGIREPKVSTRSPDWQEKQAQTEEALDYLERHRLGDWEYVERGVFDLSLIHI